MSYYSRPSGSGGAASPLTLTAALATDVPLVVKGAVSQSANLQEWRDSSGVALALVSPIGSIRSDAFTNVANSGPYVNLSGSSVFLYNRTNTANVPLIVRGMAAQSGPLQQWQDSSGTVLAMVSSGGSFYGPFVQNPSGTGPYVEMNAATVKVWNRTTVGNIPLIVQGMAGQTGNLQEWRDSANAIKAAVAADGTLYTTAGNGVVSPMLQHTSYTGTYVNLNGNGVSVINRTAATNVPLIVSGMAAQTGDLQQWQNSAGTMLARVASDGSVSSSTFGAAAIRYLNWTGPSIVLDGSNVYVTNASNAANVPLIVSGMAGQTGDLLQTQDSGAVVKFAVRADGSFYGAGAFTNTTNTNAYATFASGGLQVVNRTTTSNVPFVVKGMASQSGSLQEWQDGAGVTQTRLSGAGSLFLGATLQASIGAINGLGDNGVGTRVSIANITTAPSTNPTGGGILYAEGGALKWRGSSGTITIIAAA